MGTLLTSFSGRRLLAVPLAGALLLAACGDDDDTASVSDSDPAADDTDLGAFCEAVVVIETAPFPDIDFENATEDEWLDAGKDYGAMLVALAKAVEASAPDDISDEVATLVAATEELAETGDFEAGFEDPEVQAAERTYQVYSADACGFAQQRVVAVDYGYEDVPDRLDAGVVSFELANQGEEFHEIALFRKNAGVTESIDELLELDEEEMFSAVEFVTVGFAEPGSNGHTVAELSAGDYAMVCFLPIGGEDGPPHFTAGMFAEFTVE